MAGEDGALRFVAEMQDNASRTAEALDGTLRGVGRALPDIMAAIDLDASGAVSGAAAAATAADGVVTDFDSAGGRASAAFDSELTNGLRGIDPDAALRGGLDGVPETTGRSGTESGQSFADRFREQASQAADKASKALEENKGKLLAVGAAIGVAAGAALSEGIGGAIERADLNAKLTGQLDLTTQESARFGALAGQVYASNYGENLEEVNSAIASVVTSIGGIRTASDADLQAATQNALNLASTFDLDVAGAAQSAGILIKTGLAGNATEAFDLITAAAQAVGPAMVEPLLEASNEYATYFQALGFSGEQAFTALTEATSSGEIALDKAGDAIKEFGIRSTDGSKSTAAAYEDLGIAMDGTVDALLGGGPAAQAAMQEIITALLSIKDPGTQAVDALALFGTPLEDIGVDKIPEFLTALQSAGGELGDVAGRADELNATLGGTTGATIESLKRQFQGAFAQELGQVALPILSQVLTWATQFVGPLTAVGSVLGAVAVVVGAVSLATAAWSAAQTVATVATSVWTGAQWLLNAALAAPLAPIIAIVAGIALLVAAAVWFFTQTKIGQAIVTAVWGAIKAAIGATVDWVTGTAVPAIVAAWQWVVTTAQAIGGGVADAFNAVVGWVSGAIDAVVGAVTDKWQAIYDTTTGIFGAVSAWFMEWWPLLLAIFLPGIFLLLAAWNKWGDDILNAARTMWAFIRDSIIEPVTQFVQTVITKIGEFGGWLRTKWDEQLALTKAAWLLIKAAIIDPVVAFTLDVIAKIAAFAVAVKTKFDETVATVKLTWALIKAAVVEPVAEFVTGVAAKLAGFAAVVLGPISQAKTDATSKAREFLAVGTEIINGIKEGVTNAASRLADAVANAARGALDAAKNALGIKSPSRVFRDQVGLQIMAGWEAGMDGSGVVAEAERIAARAAAAAQGASIMAAVGAGSATVAAGASLTSPLSSGGAGARIAAPIYLTARFTNPITGEELTAFAEAIADDRLDLAAAARERSDRQNGRGR